MNTYNEISTLQYMGSKTRIISHICEPIIKNSNISTVVDLFAGTGSVGYALKSHKLHNNDIIHLIISRRKEKSKHRFVKTQKRNRLIFYCQNPN